MKFSSPGVDHLGTRDSFLADRSPYMISFGKYSKAITALVGGALGWALVVLDSAPSAITGHEWWEGAVALATALGVYGVTNRE